MENLESLPRTNIRGFVVLRGNSIRVKSDLFEVNQSRAKYWQFTVEDNHKEIYIRFCTDRGEAHAVSVADYLADTLLDAYTFLAICKNTLLEKGGA